LEQIVKPILLDTGPLVAILNRNDHYHRVCVEQSHLVLGRRFTTWPVLTEAAWLLRKDNRAIQALMSLVSTKAIEVIDLDDIAAGWISNFLNTYSDRQAQLADASLMFLANELRIETIFTLDVRDFSVYRTEHNSHLQIVPTTLR